MLARGFAVRLNVAGETLFFRGQKVPAVINSAVADSPNGDTPDFNLVREAEIEIPSADIAEPKAGEYLTSDNGTRYRVKRVAARTAYSWQIRAEPSTYTT